MIRAVSRHGWTAIPVAGSETSAPYFYTIGFWETLGSPEIVLPDVPADHANGLFWDIFSGIKNGDLSLKDFALWSDPGEEPRFVWRRLHPSQLNAHNFPTGAWYRSRPSRDLESVELPDAFQLVAPDLGGHLPWEPGYDERVRHEQIAFYTPLAPDMPSHAAAEAPR